MFRILAACFFLLLLTLPSATRAESVAERINTACMNDAEFISDDEKRTKTCACVSGQMRLFSKKKILKKPFEKLKDKDREALGRATSKSFINCMELFMPTIFDAVCEQAKIENPELGTDCACISSSGIAALKEKKSEIFDRIDENTDMTAQEILGSQDIQQHIALATGHCHF